MQTTWVYYSLLHLFILHLCNTSLHTRCHQDVTKDVTKELSERQNLILNMIKDNSFVTIPQMSLKAGVVIRTIKRDIEVMQKKGILARRGSRRDGEWVITSK